ncbi:MAG TPA: hypothetical protein VLL25_06005 [Acidimicrobiales bacterium]|nr:hypothetical protein [Acidimicrobiales bacterium]
MSPVNSKMPDQQLVDARPSPVEVDRKPATLAAVVSTAGLAAVLVVRHLGTKPLWLDETVSVSVARRPLIGLLSVLPHHDANAGVYYLLLHGWLHLGQSAAWTRSPSAISFVGTTALAAWVASRWRGAWFGFACGLLVATNRFLLFYGQEARPYALAVLLAVASTAALFWRNEKPAPRTYIAATVALLYVDLFAVLFVVAQAGAVVAIHRHRGMPVPRMLVRCWAIIAAVTAPLALLMITNQRSQISWLTRPTLRYLEQTITAMTNGWLGLTVMGGLALVALATVRLTTRGRMVPTGRLVVGALLASFVIPPFSLWLISQVVPSFIDRYVICSTVAIIGLAAVGLDVLRKRAGSVVALTILALLAAVGVSRVATLEGQAFKYENPPVVVSFIESQARPGDAVGFAGGGLRTVIDAHLPQGAPFPVDIALAPGGKASRQHDVYAREVNSATLALRLTHVQRLWLVTDPTNRRYPPFGPFAPLRPTVTEAFEPTTIGAFPGIDVTLYTRRALASQSRG